MNKLLLSCLFFCSVNAQSGEILTYSAEVKAGILKFDDPDGVTDSPIYVVPALEIHYSARRDMALFANVEYMSGSFEKNIKQDAEGYKLGFGVEQGYNLTFTFKAHLGVSINYKALSFSNRRIEDYEGFTESLFNDRNIEYGSIELRAKAFFGPIGLGIFSELSEYGPYYGSSLTYKFN